jgi:hypothetical protein
MAEMELKIKVEVEAREVLTRNYEISMNNGASRLNVETS